MKCSKCGNEIIEGDNFCRKCGNNINQKEKKKFSAWKVVFLVVACFIGVLIAITLVFFALYSFVSNTSSKMICKSDKGNITIRYNEHELVGYTAVNMEFDFDEQNEYAKDIGVEEYLKEFNTWFKENTNGTCTINGKEVKKELPSKETKEIGNDTYGYINVPNNWVLFHDIDGNDSVQYSYANIFIVSMNILEDNSYTAKEYAQNYMYNKQQSNDVEDVTGATLKIGENEQYTAYQVYMYYPEDSIYLITYWFEAEDGKTHYLALEGPEEYNDIKLSDLLYIPESFHIEK